MVDDFRQITAVTFLVRWCSSSIGLLVGGIGVMNIMLVSVTERDVRNRASARLSARAAPTSSFQFLIEAAALTGMGGDRGHRLRLADLPLISR